MKCPDKATVRCLVVSMPPGSDPPEHDAQIICGHFGDGGNRESDGLRYCNDVLEISQTPGRIATAKVPIERFVARGRCEPFAFVGP